MLQEFFFIPLLLKYTVHRVSSPVCVHHPVCVHITDLPLKVLESKYTNTIIK